MAKARAATAAAGEKRRATKKRTPTASPEELHAYYRDMLLIRRFVEKARLLPAGKLAVKIEEAFAGLDPEQVTSETLQGMLGMSGVDGTSLPGRMAEIIEVLNALTVPLRERLLVEYLNELYRTTPS